MITTENVWDIVQEYIVRGITSLFSNVFIVNVINRPDHFLGGHVYVEIAQMINGRNFKNVYWFYSVGTGLELREKLDAIIDRYSLVVKVNPFTDEIIYLTETKRV